MVVSKEIAVKALGNFVRTMTKIIFWGRELGMIYFLCYYDPFVIVWLLRLQKSTLHYFSEGFKFSFNSACHCFVLLSFWHNQVFSKRGSPYFTANKESQLRIECFLLVIERNSYFLLKSTLDETNRGVKPLYY